MNDPHTGDNVLRKSLSNPPSVFNLLILWGNIYNRGLGCAAGKPALVWGFVDREPLMATSQAPWASSPPTVALFLCTGSGCPQKDLEEGFTCARLEATIFLSLRTKRTSDNLCDVLDLWSLPEDFPEMESWALAMNSFGLLLYFRQSWGGYSKEGAGRGGNCQ